jgi:hypothetical protein
MVFVNSWCHDVLATGAGGGAAGGIAAAGEAIDLTPPNPPVIVNLCSPRMP